MGAERTVVTENRGDAPRSSTTRTPTISEGTFHGPSPLVKQRHLAARRLLESEDQGGRSAAASSTGRASRPSSRCASTNFGTKMVTLDLHLGSGRRDGAAVDPEGAVLGGRGAVFEAHPASEVGQLLGAYDLRGGYRRCRPFSSSVAFKGAPSHAGYGSLH